MFYLRSVVLMILLCSAVSALEAAPGEGMSVVSMSYSRLLED